LEREKCKTPKCNKDISENVLGLEIAALEASRKVAGIEKHDWKCLKKVSEL